MTIYELGEVLDTYCKVCREANKDMFKESEYKEWLSNTYNLSDRDVETIVHNTISVINKMKYLKHIKLEKK